jgi:molecular chaperone GrpE
MSEKDVKPASAPEELRRGKEEKKENQPKEAITDDLQKKVEELEKQKAEYLAGWQRERADFLNYKKEEMERIGGFMVYAGEEMISKMLPILDNFEIATRLRPDDGTSARQGKEEVDNFMQGILQIKKQLEDYLKSLGLEEIKSVGEPFDAKVHEVVEEVPASAAATAWQGKLEPGIIIDVVQKGYKINGRLMRPARVKILK